MRTCTYGIFNFPDFEACGKFTAVKLLNAEMLFRKAIQNALVGLHRRSVWAIAHLFIAQEIGVGYCTFIYCTGDRCGFLHIYLLHRRSVWVIPLQKATMRGGGSSCSPVVTQLVEYSILNRIMNTAI